MSATGLRTYHGGIHGGIRWTFSALRCSQITTLSVLIAADMSALLELIARELPRVAELKVLACHVSMYRDLLALLLALTSLMHLSLPIVREISYDVRETERHQLPSPQLKTLRAPVPFTLHFVMAENPLPMLKYLLICASTEIPLQPTWSIGRVLSTFASTNTAGLDNNDTFNIAAEITEGPDRRIFEQWWTTGGLMALLGTS
ncbi:hypothetical protein C8J57DRAFT_1512132 [Mycena rebaudengoi]|nr:hypothetical protein C8J57DRAFT_1512132 [Mycena rebaudengoi]